MKGPETMAGSMRSRLASRGSSEHVGRVLDLHARQQLDLLVVVQLLEDLDQVGRPLCAEHAHSFIQPSRLQRLAHIGQDRFQIKNPLHRRLLGDFEEAEAGRSATSWGISRCRMPPCATTDRCFLETPDACATSDAAQL